MKLELRGVEGEGDHDRERVIVRALEDANAGDFAIFACSVSEKERVPLAGAVGHCYWFAPIELKKNDLLVLYTKPGGCCGTGA